MNTECRAFRGALEAQLAGQPDIEGLVALGWHEHLLLCGSCRDLLEEEEALERLIASLPQVALPRELSERILARLRQAGSREAALDRLLDLDGAVEPLIQPARAEGRPDELADRVLAGLSEERRAHDGLDRLLDRVEAPTAPAGLAEGILERLEAVRSAPVEAMESRNDPLDGLLERVSAPIAPVGLSERILRRVGQVRREALPQRISRAHWVTAAAAILCVSFLTWRGLNGPALPTDGEEASRFALPSADDPTVGLPADFFHQYELLANLEQLQDPQLASDLVLAEAADETFQLTFSASDTERLDGDDGR